MADITMCDNQECEVRDKCYRAQAPVSDWQSWSIFKPCYDDGTCKFFIEFVPHVRKADIAKDW